MDNNIHIIYNNHTENYEITEKDLNIIAGNDKVLKLHVKDDDGVSIDITDFTFLFTCKSDLTLDDDSTVPEAELQYDVTSHSEPTNGKTKIEILNADTSDLLGNYMYSIKLITDDDPIKIYTVVEGLITFRQDVTMRNE